MKKSPKLRVGLVFDDSIDSQDGVAQYVKTVGAWLSSQGHQVRYLVGQSKTESWAGGRVYSLAKNQPVNFNGNHLSIPLPANRRQIHQILKSESFDILHVMMPYSPFMAQKVINSAGSDTVIVGTFHIYPSGELANLGSKLLKLATARSLAKFSGIASVSNAAADFARQAFRIESTIIPNPIDLTRFLNAHQQPNQPNSNKRIVYLGRLVKRKGCAQLLKAFAVLSNKPAGQNVELLIASDGPQRRKLEKLAYNLGVASSVQFLGYIKEAQKPALLASADVACFPSLFGESFGIVLIEAMAAGSKVVLGGDNPGYRSVLENQPMMLINPTDSQRFAQRLEELLSDNKLQQKLYKWQNIEVNKYDIENVGPKILKMYEEAIARLNKNRHNKSYE